LDTPHAKPYEGETTHGDNQPRKGSIYWRPIGPLREVTLYPLLFGSARLTTGRRDQDSWVYAYDYPDEQSGFRAAEDWDGDSDPGYGWIRKLEMGKDRVEREVKL